MSNLSPDDLVSVLPSVQALVSLKYILHFIQKQTLNLFVPGLVLRT
jgi:hypothetical protein